MVHFGFLKHELMFFLKSQKIEPNSASLTPNYNNIARGFGFRSVKQLIRYIEVVSLAYYSLKKSTVFIINLILLTFNLFVCL